MNPRIKCTRADLVGMPALTLWPEWAACIVHLDKRTENRTWTPRALPVGADIIIHAGARVGGSSQPVARAMAAMEATADAAGWSVVGFVRPRHEFRFRRHGTRVCTYAPMHTGGAVAIARFEGVDRDVRTPWDSADSWHWRLGDVRVLAAPVPMRGRLGLWTVRNA